MIKNAANLIAARTVDAYSRDRYTDAGWRGIVKALLAAGATQAEAEWVLESKHMRWAADAASRSHGVTAADFLRYANSPHVGSVEKLVLAARHELRPATTAFTPTASGADLAGACEGEQIAMALDLLRVAANGGNIQNSASLLLAEIEKRAKAGR